MVLIPAGEFLMGSPAGGEGFSDESPQRKVFVSAFLMDRTEVTNTAYARFVEATGHRPPANDNPRVTLWPHGLLFPAIAQHPVVNVSWIDALAYCRWRGARLPTEAEWEKAARGTDGRRYPWGNKWDRGKANSAAYWAERTINFESIEQFNGFWKTGEGARVSREQGINGEVLTKPVGSFPDGVSPYGLLDMAGNVAEWVSDWYEPYSYLNAPLSDPQGPNGKLLKGLRGGSWIKGGKSLRTTDRDYGLPDDRPSGAGIRCAKDAY
ncbi:MAG: formylglycine-generating enzyme family protein [Nitrospirae bacterium]|nr:formylglycine-generating enzyme family protein [Nitrospirota bacterium]